MKIYKRRPHWLKVKLPGGKNFSVVNDIVQDEKLFTVCQSARCPNQGECWGRRTATFMILGNTCTRNCRFCAVDTGKPDAVDPDEPRRLANAVKALELRYAVITSVTRDDLPDGGAGQFASVLYAVREKQPECALEVLIPDFKGNVDALRTVLDAGPDVLNHNVETVPRLYPQVRPQANYRQSLTVLRNAAEMGAVTKSGMMVGLGETLDEIKQVMQDLLDHQCRILTIGQYLQPSADYLPIDRFVTPDEFSEYKTIGMAMGFDHIESGPLVRSSYHADEQYADSRAV